MGASIVAISNLLEIMPQGYNFDRQKHILFLKDFIEESTKRYNKK